MDTRIIFGSTLLVTLVVNISMALVYRTRRTYPGFGYWLAGSFCRSIGAALFLLPRDQFPSWLTIILANYLFLAEIILFIRGTLLFRGEPPIRYGWDIAVSLSFCALFAYFIYPAPNGNARVVVFSLYKCGLDLWMLRVLLTRRPAYFGATDVCQAWIWGILVTVNLARAAYTWVFEARNIDIMAPTAIQGMMMLLLIVAAILIAFTQIIMNSQRVEYDYRMAHERLERELIERKQVEEVLREERQRMAGIIRGTNVGTWEWNVQTGEVIFNERWAEIIGYTLKEISPLSIDRWIEFAHPEDLEASNEMLKKHFRGELDYYEIEVRMKHRDGSWIWVLDRGKVTAWTEDGKPLLMMGTHQDISERKRSEEDLRESEARYRSLFEHAMEGIFQTTLDGRVLMVNPAMAHMLGYDSPREAMAKITSLSTHVYVDPQERNAAVDHVLGKGPLRGYETRFKKKNGQIITVAMNLLARRNERDDPLFFEGSCIDITSRVQAEEALRDREQLLSLIINNIPGCIAQIDCDFRYRFINNRYEPVSGLPPDKVLGHTVAEVFGEQVHQRMLPSLQRALNGETVTLETQIMNPEGKIIHGFNTYMPDFSPEGTVRGIIAVSIDVTDLKSAQEKQRRLEEQLMQAQKMESIGRLAGGIAHDFNNMLGIILGYTELAIQKVARGSPLCQDLDEVRKAAERSAALTRQLLAFARKQIANPKALDLNETVEGTLKMLKCLIGENINLSWQPGADLWQVNIDPSQIDQILANLCVNARDAIDGVGNLSIGTENVVFGESEGMAHAGFAPGEYVLLTVGDDGCGMDRKTMDRIFEPFFTTKGLGKGTGLGLSMVYGIVRQNSGFVSVYSEPGLGTTFKIYLPRRQSKIERVKEKAPSESAASGHETILLVEDEPSVLGMTKEMLERQGYTVLAAGSPGEAIRLAHTHAGEIQLLMTDVVMPGMNGLDLARKLSSLYPNLKQLFVSGYTADIIARQGVLEEGVHFIQKPFPKQALAAKLREVLG